MKQNNWATRGPNEYVEGLVRYLSAIKYQHSLKNYPEASPIGQAYVQSLPPFLLSVHWGDPPVPRTQ